LSIAVGIGLGREPVVDPAAFAAALYDARRPERREVARDMGLRQSKGFLEMAHAELLVREERHDPESSLVPQGLEEAGDRANVESDRHTYIRISGYRNSRKRRTVYFALVRSVRVFLTSGTRSPASSRARSVFGAEVR